jgi:hypothetical protein
MDRNEERERTEQHPNGDGIEHDEFDSRHRLLTTRVYRFGGVVAC